MMSREILIYGAGGAGRDLAFALSLDKNPGTSWKVKGFVDDTEQLWGKKSNDVPVLGGFEILKSYSGNLAVTIVNDPFVRQNLIMRIKKSRNIQFPLVISPHCLISTFIEWGEGCIVGSAYNMISVNIKIGDFVYVHGGNRIGHDVVVEAYTTIYSMAFIGGGAYVGANCVIGSRAVILPKVKIGESSIIGAGSVVNKDIPQRVVVAGVPAKIIRENK
jgi:sugar O-acyltransferase (sialic acid O-acetyltransferase NeuD family)